jgi:flagellar protein FliO/FliZ
MHPSLKLAARCSGRLFAAVAVALYGATARAAAAAADAKVPPLEVEPMAAGSLAQMILGLTAVLALILGLAWVMRRMGGIPGAAAGSLRVLGGLSMGTRERVVLIQVGETQLLIGVAPGRVQTLHVLEQPVQLNETNPPGKGNFAASLNAALRRSKTS